MPGGITLLESLPADIPTPAAGKDTIFVNLTTGEPSYKDDAGVTHTLVGAAGTPGTPGTPGANGTNGSQGPPGFGSDGGENEYIPPSNVNPSVGSVIKTILATVNGAGVAITTGVKGYIQIPIACTILSWTILGLDGLTGSIVFDLWVDTYANFPPTVADTITAAAKPTITASNKNTSATLTGWSTTIPAGSILGINVDSISTFQIVALEIVVRTN